MSVDDVIGLLGELRSAEGRIEKARVLGRGLLTLRDLSPTERRDVALAVAERAAPQLVPELASRTGLDLDGATVAEILDLARDLDEDELEGIIARLRDPERRWELLETTVEHEPEPSAETGRVEPAPPERVADPEIDAATPLVVGTDPVTRPEPQTVVEPEPVPEPDPVPEPAIIARAPTRPDVIEQVRAARTPLGQLRAVDEAGERIYDLGADGRLELVRALPDGWVRRRGVERLLALDVVAAGDCEPILRSFGRPSDRRWVAASMLTAGLLEPAALHGLLEDRDVRRLVARVED